MSFYFYIIHQTYELILFEIKKINSFFVHFKIIASFSSNKGFFI